MARRHIADAEVVTLNIVIHEVEEIGGSIARHSHEFERERGAPASFRTPERMRLWGTRGCRGTGRTVVVVRTMQSLQLIGGR